MFKLLHNSTHFTCQQSNVQNSPTQVSTVYEPKTSRFSSWSQKRQSNQRSNCQHTLNHRKRKRIPENVYFCFIDYTKAVYFVDHNKLWKILKVMGIPEHHTCLLRNLYAGQEATVRTGHGTTDWFKIGKGVSQSCISSSCLFKLYTSCEMPGWMKHKLESRLPGEISITSDMQMTPHLQQKAKKN